MRMPFLYSRKKWLQKSNTFTSSVVRPASKAEQIADEVIHVFETRGAEDYFAGPVSQASHMVQCAMLAMESFSELPVIIGALLHDIGHLLTHEYPTETMGKVGVTSYEAIGGAYLRTKGFSERVCAIVEQQVAARRYLVTTDEDYKNKVSYDSLQTLSLQGGPMSTAEAAAFEKIAYFTDIINICRWNEQANNTNAVLVPVTWFWKLLWDHLYYRVA